MARCSILLFVLACIVGCTNSEELNRLRAEAQALKAEVEVLKAKATEDAKRANDELTALKSELEKLKSKFSADLKKANDEVTLLREEVASLKEADKTPKEELRGPNEKKLTADEVQDLLKLGRRKLELDDLKADLLAMQHDIARRESDVGLLTQEIKELDGRIAKSRSDISALRDKLEKGAESIQFAGKNYTANEVQQALQARFNAHKVLASSLAEQENQLQRLTALLRTAKGDLEGKQAMSETRQSELDALRAGLPDSAADKLLEVIESTDVAPSEERLKEIVEALNELERPAEDPK